MKTGDRVTWTSQAQGSVKTKVGTIVVVVPEKVNPRYIRLPNGCRLDFPGYARDHESYIVQVDNRKLLYWPKVSNLKRVEPKPDPYVALKEIHRIAEWQTYRDTCDACRNLWAEVTRIARDAHGDLPAANEPNPGG